MVTNNIRVKGEEKDLPPSSLDKYLSQSILWLFRTHARAQRGKVRSCK